MIEQNFCVAIPDELLTFSRGKIKNYDKNTILDVSKTNLDFGVKLYKDSRGKFGYAAYYSDNGDLIKRVCYDGPSIIQVDKYRDGLLYCKEKYNDNKLCSKLFYNKFQEEIALIEYTYNRQNKIISIQKSMAGKFYMVEYGYDELNRVNKRKISVDHTIITEQKYRFDILDRIVEYSDLNQKIKILQMSPNNELIYYTITDRMGNEISVINKFDESGYKSTDVTLNGHTTSVKNRSYVDNVMLKKPYTREEDLDLIISQLFNKEAECKTKRCSDSSADVIDSAIRVRILPISIRKRLLYNLSVT